MPNLLILLACLILGVFSRWLPHPPNFTPVIAIAIFIGMRFQQKWLVVLTPLAIMFISDIFLGFHNTAIVTYASLILLSLAVMSAPKNGIFKSKSIQIASFSLVGSIWFFLLSNASVWWFTDMYSHNLTGLKASYIAGLPFFKNTLISTLVFSTVLVLVDKWILRHAPSSSLAKV
ncbi:MAG: hypothetical protein KDD58_06095 [Bdellovibrionales bacterium]|nr:hypothetical protein [Bdellovibrionales bacterium]